MENLTQNPADTILFAHHCQDLLKEKKIKEAIDVCEKGVRNFPFYAEGHYILGRCYQALGQIDEAKNELERTLFFAPVHLKALNSLAFILYKKKLKNIADEYLLTVALNDPLNYELHEYLKEESLYEMLYPPFVSQENMASEVAGEEKTDTDVRFLEEEVTPAETEENTDTVFLDTQVLFATSDKEEDIEEETEEEEQEPKVEGSALELDDSREAFEVNSIIENISEVEANKLDLSQYANIEDDFSTLLSSMEKDFQDTLNEGMDDDNNDQNDDALRREEELLAEEKPFGNTAILFNNPPNYTEPEGEEIEIIEPQEEPEKLPEISVLEEKEEVSEQTLDIGGMDSESLLTEDINAEEESRPENNPDELSKIIDQLENREEAPPQKVSVENIEQEPEEEPQTAEGDINEIMNNDSLVTPTFGEILIAQKKFGEARRVFAKLAEEDPGNDRYKKKIQFLDKLIAMQK